MLNGILKRIEQKSAHLIDPMNEASLEVTKLLDQLSKNLENKGH